jgi:protein TonB
MSAAAPAPVFPYWKAFVAALLLHGLLFLLVSTGLVAPPQFGVAVGTGSIEVSLVSAPPHEPEPDRAEQEVPPPPETPQEDDMALSRVQPHEVMPPPPELEKPKPAPVRPAVTQSETDRKDETPPKPSGSGAIYNAKPDYLQNPPPPYPEKARRAGREGVVRLKVFIDEKGRPTEVVVRSSSGDPLLDETARAHVLRTWKFRPARALGIPVKGQVEIPVRFDLNN